MNVKEIEKSMPSGITFTAFTAFRLKFRDVPADYSEVYVYAEEEELGEIKKRFPQKGGPANLIVLLKPEKFGNEKIVSNELMFVDLWNLKEWYAKEFLKALRQKMGQLYDYRGDVSMSGVAIGIMGIFKDPEHRLVLYYLANKNPAKCGVD